jgi:pimeloyl-ACP methyl ester carboxylesterase
MYPGGKVNIQAYCPLLFQVANSSVSTSTPITAVIVPMPLNLAFFGSGKANEVLDAFPSISRWMVGGHSLGGAFSAEYAATNINPTGKIKGLVTLAAGPARSMKALNSNELQITSISGSLDGLWTLAKQAQAEADQWPPHSTHVKIEGGNHAQFGDYGKQAGDNDATISVAQQRSIVVSRIIELASKL